MKIFKCMFLLSFELEFKFHIDAGISSQLAMFLRKKQQQLKKLNWLQLVNKIAKHNQEFIAEYGEQ